MLHGGDGVSRLRLAAGLLGGMVAWLLHLAGAWYIAEWGCQRGFPALALGPLNGVVVALLGLTVATVGLAAGAGMIARRCRRELATVREEGIAAAAGYDTARLGVMLDAAGLMIILVQSIPIFFYLRAC